MMRSIISCWFPFAITVALLTSCGPGILFEEHVDIKDNVWDRNEPVKFEFSVPDDLSPYNLFIHLRHSGSYPFSNIWVFIDAEYPDGQSDRDTVEFILSDNYGKWLGDGLGDLWDTKNFFKHLPRFPKSGMVRIKIEQAMRMDKLPLILDVGLSVEKISETRK